MVLLAAVGVNLDQIGDRFGIDLGRLTGGASNGSLSSGSSGQVSGQRHAGAQWSSTSPEINLWHVFEGEINRSGKPVGFHSRPGGQDVPGARVKQVRDGPNSAGVYTANIEIEDGGRWLGKFSSFFPDSMSRDEVIAAIINAHRNSSNPQAQPFSGPSGHGFTIQGYTSSRGGINTAFPLYTR